MRPAVSRTAHRAPRVLLGEPAVARGRHDRYETARAIRMSRRYDCAIMPPMDAPTTCALLRASLSIKPARFVADAARSRRRGDRVRQTGFLLLEGIVSKRIGSRYVSGRTRAWLK